jgi:ATP-dependent Clp protease adaptor protein ClpS
VELLRAGAEKVAPPQLLQDPDEDADRSRPWRVVVHNDDYTPMEYVTQILHQVFRLGWAKAVLVMARAHMAGRADVAILPRDEASQRIAAAHARARGDGWPLHFTKEPVD